MGQRSLPMMAAEGKSMAYNSTSLASTRVAVVLLVAGISSRFPYAAIFRHIAEIFNLYMQHLAR
jgi:hypothetical protein